MPPNGRNRGGALRLAGLLALVTPLVLGGVCESPHEDVGRQNFVSPQANPIALSPDGTRLYVANTTSNSVSAIDTATLETLAEIPVGIEPVGVAVHPSGLEVWASNHVSDSVSVIDANPANPTYLTVVHTIDEVDSDGVTLFDEPVGIAFTAGGAKAYVALSSTNDIAVIDSSTYEIASRIHVTAQDPRAIAVRNELLYVIPFESTNQSELSLCPAGGEPPQCTLDIVDAGDFVTQPNLPGRDVRIVIDPDAPDRDLYVYDTATDELVSVVSGVGTLLYGVAVSSAGEVFITQTDARNAENGEGGQNLIELENRIFANQIARVSCGVDGASCGAPTTIDLEPPLPAQPAPGEELATPYGIAISDDDSTLVVTAAGTSRLFTVDTSTGDILDLLDLGPAFGQQIPKGVALRSDGTGAPQIAYVLNTLQNTVSVVDVSEPGDLQALAKIPVGSDRTPIRVRLGRIAFANAFASDTGTFSCESCHPDGNTDQLLWRIGGACFFGACSGEDEVRSTMPVRGLKNTLPLHWDGTLGDPFGGRNGSTGPFGNEAPNCTDEHSCFRQLVDASLSGVMCNQDGGCQNGPTGLPGGLSEFERENMASFLASVSYPPSRERSTSDALSASAMDGVSDFFVDHGGVGNVGGVRACSDMDNGCHSLPLLVSTNSPTLQGFDAPTLRGLNDRILQFSLGVTMPEESLEAAKVGGMFPLGAIMFPALPSPIPWDPEEGYEEAVTFAASFGAFTGIYNVGPVDIFQMLQEMSTGFSGAFGRQISLNAETAGPAQRADTEAAVAALEAADARGVVNLRAEGVTIDGDSGFPILISYRAETDDYASLGETRTREQLLDDAADGSILVTLTAALRANYGEPDFPQPLLFPAQDGEGPIGNPDIPLLPSAHPLTLRGTDIREGAALFVNGQPAPGTITCQGGSYTPFCDSGVVVIELQSPPAAPGMHTVQVQNPMGPLSNEMPVCVGERRQDCL